ncbi:MAG: YdcH family protein [Proteobacteria bacterium]|nr:YdcH family protein [Pseudomonadota bacterium]
MSDSIERSIQKRIYELQIEHRDLNVVVDRLVAQSDVDQLMLRRLKQKKLFLKDQISRLKSELIPNLDA